MAAVASTGKKSETIYVNVVNMIDILIILLVFLLTNFATSTFEDVNSLPVKMPVFGQASTEPPPPGKKEIQNLEVRMRQDPGPNNDKPGFQIVVTITGEMPASIEVPMTDATVKEEKGVVRAIKDFDYEKLSKELLNIKQNYQSRQDILLEAEKKLPFEKIVKAMDACRDIVSEDPGSKQKAYVPLFPSVALTDLPF
jgi:biopolymer transport protein ExbD